MTQPDTIAAIATAPGQGGIGIIRLSGPLSAGIAEHFLGRPPRPRYAHYASFRDSAGEAIDQGILLFFQAPASFTGEDVVELQIHGGPVVLDRLLREVVSLGCRQARAGEFSERAFLNDRIDLLQAEAIADLISAESEQSARAAMHSLQGEFSSRVHSLLQQLIELRVHVESALDFPEEEIDFLADAAISDRLDAVIGAIDDVRASSRQGRLLREGLDAVITGRPNAGKSSLLNALAGYDSAIVSEQPGTTRDTIRERIVLDGVALHVIDTAGIRESADSIEQQGVSRAMQAIDRADIVIRVIDTTAEAEDQGIEGEILVHNKIDLAGIEAKREGRSVWMSAKNAAGLDLLKACILETAGFDSDAQAEGRFSARRRHTEAIERLAQQAALAAQALARGDGEILAEELRIAQNILAGITGEFRADDLLGEIFSEFCIGK